MLKFGKFSDPFIERSFSNISMLAHLHSNSVTTDTIGATIWRNSGSCFQKSLYAWTSAPPQDNGLFVREGHK